MPIFIDKFLFPVLAGAFLLLVLVNPMKFDTIQRSVGGVIVLLIAYFAHYTFHKKSSDDAQSIASEPSLGTGGNGGNAKVGGNGIAIGGPGGNRDKYGHGGGNGGSAEVQGDGLAAGGAGGSVDSDDLWSPPARSGYEVAMEATGQPIDPKMRQYGRGAPSSGYAFRYGIVEKIRGEYFESHHETQQSVTK